MKKIIGSILLYSLYFVFIVAAIAILTLELSNDYYAYNEQWCRAIHWAILLLSSVLLIFLSLKIPNRSKNVVLSIGIILSSVALVFGAYCSYNEYSHGFSMEYAWLPFTIGILAIIYPLISIVFITLKITIMKKICPNCGKPLADENAKFCSECGAPITQDTQKSAEILTTPKTENANSAVQNTKAQAIKKQNKVTLILAGLAITGIFVLFGILSTIDFGNSSSESSSAEYENVTTETVYTADGIEIVLRDDGTAEANGVNGWWNRRSTYMGNREIYYIDIQLNNDYSIGIYDNKAFFGARSICASLCIKEHFNDGIPLTKIRR